MYTSPPTLLSTPVGTNFQQLQKEILTMISSLPKPKKLINILEKNLPISASKKMLPHYRGLGTVLNIWTNPYEGQMIHLIVRDGEVLPGMWFSAGGWAGKILEIPF